MKNNVQNVKFQGRENDTNIYPSSPYQRKGTSNPCISLEDFPPCIRRFSYKPHTNTPKPILNTYIRNHITSLFTQ